MDYYARNLEKRNVFRETCEKSHFGGWIQARWFNQGRFGSLITDVEIPAGHRPDKEFCLNKYNGTCGKCVEQCVTGALTENGQNRHVYYSKLLENMDHYEDEGMADVCGKCAGVVPCSYHNPVKAEAK